MLLYLCRQDSTITCDLKILGLWWGAGVYSVLLIKSQPYKGSVSLGLRAVVFLGLLPLCKGAVLSPFQILAPLLKENLFCFLSALPPGSVKEARHKRHTVCDSSSTKCPELTNLETERKPVASRGGREEVTANGCGGRKAIWN